ncbi:MAG: sulfotransferase [Candidatus Nealsonbacteria bacterium]
MLAFIFSTGRNGGGFVKSVLSSVGVSCCHERRPRILRLFNNTQNTFLRKIGYKLIKSDLKRVNKKNSVQIEHNCMIPTFVDNIVKDFPDSIFIHQIRDPRDWVKSAINRSMTNSVRRFFTVSLPCWVSRPNKYSLGSDPVSKMFEMQVLNWVNSNKIYSGLKNKTDKYFLLKYEDLGKDSLSFIKRIMEICGLSEFFKEEILKESINRASRNESRKFIGSWETWDEKYIIFLYNHCKDLMEEHGYGKEEEWQRKINNLFNYEK